MRKLGFGQSVAFILPPEMSMKIRERTRNEGDVPVTVEDVLVWSITESWCDLRRSMPLWAVQGHRYESNKRFFKGKDTTVDDAKNFLEPEAQTLEHRYRPEVQDIDGKARLSGWDTSNESIMKIVKRCEDFSAMGFSIADLEEEQEVRHCKSFT